MKTLSEKLNVKIGSAKGDNAVEFDPRRDINVYDTFCKYCADNDVNINDVSNADFDYCVEKIESLVNNARLEDETKVSFWLDM